jgi:hypothetical protein
MPTIESRNRRFGLDLPIVVTARDAGDTPFREATHTFNVSGGGLCFECTRDLPIGTRLELKIALPPRLRPKFRGLAVYRVRAVVCRAERLSPGAAYRVGVRFLGEITARS